MDRTKIRRASSLAALAAVSAVARPAGAYNWMTHQRIVEVAVDAMNASAAAPPPPGIDAGEWSAYTRTLRDALERLRLLQSDLPGAYRGGSYPGRAVPGTPPSFDPRVESHNDPALCGYRGTTLTTARPDLNLLHAGAIRILDLPYLVNKAYVPCAYTPLTRGSPWNGWAQVLGRTLGWHGASVDDHVDDSVLWLRPTNSGVAGLVKEASNRVVETGLAALALPVVCLARLLSGESCSVDDARDVAAQSNPVELLEGALPGVHEVRSEDYVGVWHFVHVGASRGRHNDVRGMLYEGAGSEHPGAIDVAIMAAADLAGLSLNASASNGTSQYGPYDRVPRQVPHWQAHTIGHLEFSSLGNLAAFGWDRYVAAPTRAGGLGWPLHAVGDAAAPHHVVGTTSFGHRPLEDAVDEIREALLPLASADAAFRDRVLHIGFRAYAALRANPSVRAYIEREAQETRALVRAAGDWHLDDAQSIAYHADVGGSRRSSIDRYKASPERLRPLLEHGVGYAIGLLTHAGAFAQDPGAGDVLCPPGEHFTGEGTGCAPGTPPPPPGPVTTPAGLCGTFASCEEPACTPHSGQCRASSECCAGLVCLGASAEHPGACTTNIR